MSDFGSIPKSDVETGVIVAKASQVLVK